MENGSSDPIAFACDESRYRTGGEPELTLAWISHSSQLGRLMESMEASYVSLPTLEKLRAYVLEVLCTREHLDPNATPFFQGAVLRAGKTCGLLLQIEGPRLLRTHAIC